MVKSNVQKKGRGGKITHFFLYQLGEPMMFKLIFFEGLFVGFSGALNKQVSAELGVSRVSSVKFGVTFIQLQTIHGYFFLLVIS